MQPDLTMPVCLMADHTRSQHNGMRWHHPIEGLPAWHLTSSSPSAITRLKCQSRAVAAMQGLTGSVGRYVSFMQQATAGYNQEAALAHALASAQGSAAHSSATPLLGSAPAPQLAQAHFSSLCEHHLLPFQGVLRVAVCAQHAWPALQALVQQLAACYARRLQIQERLTHEVADALMPLAQHGSVLVVCDAVHMCMVARGVEQHASSTLTVAARGRFESEVVLRSEALQQMLEPQTG